jgi:hypothetical protein
MRAVGYAADSDEQALRDAGAMEVLHSLDRLRNRSTWADTSTEDARSMIARMPIADEQDG